MNVGIVNFDAQNTRTWQILHASETTTMTLPPMSMHLITLPRPPNTEDPFLVRFLGDGGSQTTWVAFGSSVENVSGDAWSSIAYSALRTVIPKRERGTWTVGLRGWCTARHPPRSRTGSSSGNSTTT